MHEHRKPPSARYNHVLTKANGIFFSENMVKRVDRELTKTEDFLVYHTVAYDQWSHSEKDPCNKS